MSGGPFYFDEELKALKSTSEKFKLFDKAKKSYEKEKKSSDPKEINGEQKAMLLAYIPYKKERIEVVQSKLNDLTDGITEKDKNLLNILNIALNASINTLKTTTDDKAKEAFEKNLNLLLSFINQQTDVEKKSSDTNKLKDIERFFRANHMLHTEIKKQSNLIELSAEKLMGAEEPALADDAVTESAENTTAQQLSTTATMPRSDSVTSLPPPPVKPDDTDDQQFDNEEEIPPPSPQISFDDATLETISEAQILARKAAQTMDENTSLAKELIDRTRSFAQTNPLEDAALKKELEELLEEEEEEETENTLSTVSSTSSLPAPPSINIGSNFSKPAATGGFHVTDRDLKLELELELDPSKPGEDSDVSSRRHPPARSVSNISFTTDDPEDDVSDDVSIKDKNTVSSSPPKKGFFQWLFGLFGKKTKPQPISMDSISNAFVARDNDDDDVFGATVTETESDSSLTSSVSRLDKAPKEHASGHETIETEPTSKVSTASLSSLTKTKEHLSSSPLVDDTASTSGHDAPRTPESTSLLARKSDSSFTHSVSSKAYKSEESASWHETIATETTSRVSTAYLSSLTEFKEILVEAPLDETASTSGHDAPSTSDTTSLSRPPSPVIVRRTASSSIEPTTIAISNDFIQKIIQEIQSDKALNLGGQQITCAVIDKQALPYNIAQQHKGVTYEAYDFKVPMPDEKNNLPPLQFGITIPKNSAQKDAYMDLPSTLPTTNSEANDKILTAYAECILDAAKAHQTKTGSNTLVLELKNTKLREEVVRLNKKPEYGFTTQIKEAPKPAHKLRP